MYIFFNELGDSSLPVTLQFLQQVVDPGFQDVPNGEDSQHFAVVVHDRQVAVVAFQHDLKSLSGGGFVGRHFHHGAHQFTYGGGLSVTAAKGELGQDVALGKHAGDDAVLVDNGDGANVLVHHHQDCIFDGGQHRNRGRTLIAPLQQTHNPWVSFLVAETARVSCAAAGVKRGVAA